MSEKVCKYSDAEIDEAWNLHQHIVATKDVPLPRSIKDIGTPVVSGIMTYYLFWPSIGGLWIINMLADTPFRKLMWFGMPESAGGFMILFVLFVNIVYALCALYGLICLVTGEAFSKEDEYKQAFKEHAEKMEIALDQQEEYYKEQIEDLQVKVSSESASNSLLKVEQENLNKLFDQQDKEYKNKINLMKEDFAREKRLWALEKKELQLSLKSKLGLLQELDDSESPLGGLYK